MQPAGGDAGRGSRPATGCGPRTSIRPAIPGCRAMRAASTAWSRPCARVLSFPTANAHGKGENPQWVYTVVFDGREIWGEDADPTLTVSIDAWESYLEPA